MKKIILVILFLLGSSLSYADVFDRANAEDNSNLLKQAIQKDDRGYYYQAYTDLNMASPPDDPKVSVSANGNLGCSNFNFNSNFTNQFKAMAAANTLANLGKNAVAASPMLLLEYASPTLADLVKHFSTSSNMRLGMLYAQCEDIEKSVGDEMDKLRKKSEKECVSAQQNTDLDAAMQQCKSQSDPFAYLKDSKGEYLLKGGQINVLEDILKKTQMNPDAEKELLKRSPNKVISSANIKNTGAEESIDTVFYNARDGYVTSLHDTFNQYVANPKSVTQDQLDEISMPGVPVTTNTLDSLAMLDKYDRQLKFSQMATSLSYYKTITKYRGYIDKINSTKLTANLDDNENKYLDSLTKFYEDSIKTMQTNLAMRKDHASILQDTITEAEQRKLRAISQLNTSDKYKEIDKSTAEKGMLMLGDDN